MDSWAIEKPYSLSAMGNQVKYLCGWKGVYGHRRGGGGMDGWDGWID